MLWGNLPDYQHILVWISGSGNICLWKYLALEIKGFGYVWLGMNMALEIYGSKNVWFWKYVALQIPGFGYNWLWKYLFLCNCPSGRCWDKLWLQSKLQLIGKPEMLNICLNFYNGLIFNGWGTFLGYCQLLKINHGQKAIRWWNLF